MIPGSPLFVRCKNLWKFHSSFYPRFKPMITCRAFYSQWPDLSTSGNRVPVWPDLLLSSQLTEGWFYAFEWFFLHFKKKTTLKWLLANIFETSHRMGLFRFKVYRNPLTSAPHSIYTLYKMGLYIWYIGRKWHVVV